MAYAAVLIAWQMAMVPLVLLSVLHATGRRFPAVWWAVAGALGISWVADTASWVIGPSWEWIFPLFYPVAQALLVGWFVLNRPNYLRFAGLLGVIVFFSLLANGGQYPEVIVRTVAWLVGGLISWDSPLPTALRACLVVTFGLGWALWVWHTATLSVWPSWYAYQGSRALGIGVFAWGAWRTRA